MCIRQAQLDATQQSRRPRNKNFGQEFLSEKHFWCPQFNCSSVRLATHGMTRCLQCPQLIRMVCAELCLASPGHPSRRRYITRSPYREHSGKLWLPTRESQESTPDWRRVARIQRRKSFRIAKVGKRGNEMGSLISSTKA